MLRTMTVIFAIAFLTACTAEVEGPEAKVKVPGAKIEVGEADSKFCPPGQAKKGRC
jgi:hypothetical protein